MNATIKLNLIRGLSAVMLLLSANIAALVLFAAVAMSIGLLHGKPIPLLSPLAVFAILAGYVSSIALAFKFVRGGFSSRSSYFYFPFILLGVSCGFFLEYSVRHQADAKIGLLYGTLEIPSLVILVIAYWQSKFQMIRRRA